MKKTILFIFMTLSILSCKSQQFKNYNKPLAELLSDSLFLNKPVIVCVEKSKYKLSIMIDSITVKAYPVVFGGNPIDDKLKQGDKCTPEGKFKIRTKYPHQSWSKFIRIDYPNEDSWAKHKQAKAVNKIPENANIGGEIGIHGVPEGMDYLIDNRINWTLGCISMKNIDVEEIYPYLNENTEVKIVH